ncbi:hypothetical protein [Roseovarius sp. M141]|uniref:hypothetical protein n=1 Tax=Roseovarius sp. M141 TaxID=2583806 RepID=UPI00337D131F|nr:hypothetical protein [Roseovarius sp. M141]
MDLLIGLDVSLASTAICVLNAHGKVARETTGASEPEELVAALRALSGKVVAVGLEAGPLSQRLHKHLTEAGCETVLMEARQVKGALKAMPTRLIAGTHSASRGSCRWAGSGQCIANRCRRRKCGRC